MSVLNLNFDWVPIVGMSQPYLHGGLHRFFEICLVCHNERVAPSQFQDTLFDGAAGSSSHLGTCREAAGHTNSYHPVVSHQRINGFGADE